MSGQFDPFDDDDMRGDPACWGGFVAALAIALAISFGALGALIWRAMQ